MHAVNASVGRVSLLYEAIVGYVFIYLDIFLRRRLFVRHVIYPHIHCIWTVEEVGYPLVLASFSLLAHRIIYMNRCSRFQMMFFAYAIAIFVNLRTPCYSWLYCVFLVMFYVDALRRFIFIST